MTKRITAFLLSLCMLIVLLPTAALADNDVYTIANRYITYSINTKTGGFSVKTADGHPDKSYDNDMPLLYKAGEGSDETSFVTVRIDGTDYIFGREYGLFGMSSSLSTPRISNAGRLIETTWTIKGYEVTQKVALSLDEDNNLTGNLGISYEVKNTNGSAGNVGIRILYDAALGNDVDAPYVTPDDKIEPIITEQEFSGDSMPIQLRAVDSVSDATKASYLLFSGWNVDYSADKVIVGHWANLANTRYEYEPDTYCDFTNYSNVYRVPDSAYAIYWSEQELPAGGTRTAELLYGVGNFSSTTQGGKAGLDIMAERVRLNAAGDGYLNNGEFKVTVNFDNSVDGSVPLETANVALKAEDGLTVVSQADYTYGDINAGQIYEMEFTVKADPQSQITSKKINVVLSGMDKEGNVIAETASRYVLLPGLTSLPNIQINRVSPKIVYILGDKFVTVSGDLTPLSALRGTDGWDLYLEHTTTDEKIRIEKKNITFAEDFSSLTFKVSDDLTVGKYKMVFYFRDSELISNYGVNSITASVTLETSADKKYAVRSYGVVALVRYEKTKYKFVKFDIESEYQSFVEGKITAGGIKHDFSTSYTKDGDTANAEILLTVRGKIKELEKDGKVYYSADTQEDNVTINNMLSYKGDTPLIMEEKNGTYIVKGNGEIKVINSITVWKNEWSFKASGSAAYSLNAESTDLSNAKDLTLSLDGAAFLIQSIGGFLIDLKFGVMTGDNDDGVLTHGISFGGKISIPIKDPSQKKDDPKTSGGQDDDDDYSEDMSMMFAENDSDKYTTAAKTNKSDFKKDTNFSDGNLSAEIESILYGEKTEKVDGYTKVTGTGFVGINTTISLGLPEDILGKFIENAPGVYASVTINTIDNYYELSAGLKIKVIECEGTLAFKQVTVKNKDVVVPDKIEFYIRDGLKIPLAPPLFITGLGGGINGLADTIGGDFDRLPPITLLLFTRLELIETMIGDFNAAISLSGIDLKGDMKFKEDKKGTVFNLELGISARWIDPWHLSAYGKVSVIDGLIKGTVALIIADNLFYGYGCVAVCIPDSVPVLGGKELAQLEAAVSNTFIGTNIKIIGIKFGVIYYWSGEFNYGTGIDLAPPMLMSTPEDNGSADTDKEYTAMYGTNIHKLSSTKVGRPVLLADGISSVTKNFNPETEDALLIEVPLEGTIMPDISAVTLTDPDGGNIPLYADDGNGGGNFLAQSRDDGNFIYISITDDSQLKAGDWTVTVNSEYSRVKDFSIYGADDIPEITSTSVSNRTDDTSRDFTVTWENSGTYEGGTVDIYVTDNPNAIEEAKATQTGVKDAFGTSVAHLDYTGQNSAQVTLPESFPSGDYYVVTMISSEKYGISAKMSSSTFKFTNNALPNPIKSAELYYAGNNELCVRVEDADTVDYTDYLVNILAEDGTVVPNSFAQIGVGDDIIVGKSADLQKGKAYRVEISTLNETDDGGFYYGTERVLSNEFTIPDTPMPVLLSVETNVKDGMLSTNEITATYKFSAPVYMRATVNGVDTPTGDTNEFKDTWTYTDTLEDGEYVIDFKAYNKSKDYVTGEDFEAVPNAIIGVTVDSTAPTLTLGQEMRQTEDNGSAPFGTNVVRASADGSYLISGHTESNITLTADGSEDGITVGADNIFTLTGTIEKGMMKKEVELKATDAAGNTSYLTVTVLPDTTAFTEIRIKSGGADIAQNDEGEKVVELMRFDGIDLEVYGVLEDGTEVRVDPSDVTWTVLGEKNIVSLGDTGALALRNGETAVKANVGSAVLEDGANISTGKEDYVIFEVKGINGTPMDIEPDYADIIDIISTKEESGTRLTVVPKEGYDGELPLVMVYTAIFDETGTKLLDIKAKETNLDNSIFVDRPKSSPYKIFIWSDKPVTKVITEQTTGANKLFP
ncbi:MAG: hypothetical protein J5590_05380 [Clostridia bacterium]|nr:hypothetical protein [Clostridia bacterium]